MHNFASIGEHFHDDRGTNSTDCERKERGKMTLYPPNP